MNINPKNKQIVRHMNLVRRTITLALVISIFAIAQAQELLQMVPKEATFVGMINAGQIKSKGQLAEMMELPFMQEFDKQMAKEFSRAWVKSDSGNYFDLSKHGIKTSGKAWSYFVTDKEFFYGGMLIPLTDQEKFKSFVKILTKDPESEKITTKNDYTETHHRDLHIVWNKSTALLYGVELNPVFKDSIDRMLKKQYGFGYNDKNYDEIVTDEMEEALVELQKSLQESEEVVIEEEPEVEIEENVEDEIKEEKPEMTWSEFYDIKRAYRDSIKEIWVKENGPKLISSRGNNSFASNADFVDYIKSSPEMAMVFDYALLRDYMTTPLMSGMSRAYRRNKFIPYLMSFYGDVTVFAKLEFKQDEAELSVDTKYGERIGEVLKSVKKKKISKKFLKYMNNDLMGYYAIGMDVEGVGEGLKNMLKKTLPEVPEYGKAAVKGVEIMEIFIDEKAIYNLFTGDAVVAVNGIKEFEVEYKTYDYDDDFNRTEIVDTMIKKLPEVVFMAEVGNKEDVQKFIDLLVYLKAFKKEGNMYSLDIKRNDIPVCMQIHDNILFIGNNKEFIRNPAELPRDKQLDKEHKKAFKKNTIAGFVNMAEIMRYLADNEKSSFKDQKMFVETSNLFRNIKMTGYKKGNYMHAKYSVNLAESNENSMVDIIKYINQMYLIDTKKL
jgi:hypothetical protein